MSTLDIMGYTSEQLMTIPFLVLNRALTKYEKNQNESNKKILDRIQETCIKLIESN